MPRLFRPRVLPVAKQPLSTKSWEVLKSFDDQLSERETASTTPCSDLRQFLDQVPRRQRGVEYVERVVCLYGTKKMKGPRCYSLVQQMRERRVAAGEAELFANFEKRLSDAIHPYHLTFHGYNIPFKDRETEAISDELRDIIASIEALGHVVFINSGTLLGAVRDHAFILHDDDVDLAVILPATCDKDVLSAHYGLHDELTAMPDLVIDEKFSSKSPVLKIQTKSGLTVDIFPAWWIDNRLQVWPHTRGELDRSDVLPLGRENIGGISFPTPREPEKMLAVNYGAKWRRPDPHFSFDWRGARERFRPVIKQYRRDRLRDQCLQSLRFFRNTKPN